MGGDVEHRRPHTEGVDRLLELRRQLAPAGQDLGERPALEAGHLGGGLRVRRRPRQPALEHVLPHRGEVGHDVADAPARAGRHRRLHLALVELGDQRDHPGLGLAVEL